MALLANEALCLRTPKHNGTSDTDIASIVSIASLCDFTSDNAI